MLLDRLNAESELILPDTTTKIMRRARTMEISKAV